MLYKARWYNDPWYDESYRLQRYAGVCCWDDADQDDADSPGGDGGAESGPGGDSDGGFDDDLGGFDDFGFDPSGFTGSEFDTDYDGANLAGFSLDDFESYTFNDEFNRGFGFDKHGNAYDNAFEAAIDRAFDNVTIADVFDSVAKTVGFAFGGPIGGALASVAVSVARGEGFSQAAVTALANSTGIPGLEMALENTELGREVTSTFEEAVGRGVPDEVQGAYSDLSQAFGGSGSFDLGGFNADTGEFDFGDQFGSQFDDKEFARNVFGTFANAPTDFNFNTLENAELTRRRDALAEQNDPFFKNLLDNYQSKYLDTNIEAFLDELQRPAQEEVGIQVARGNLNTFGGKNANQVLSQQRQEALDFLEPTIESLRGQYTTGISDIEGLADEAARGYDFGGEFDFGPFRNQADEFNSSFAESITPSLRDAAGTRTFFDPNAAFTEGAGVQGLTSGPRNSQDLINLLAGRSDPRNENRKVNRGLGFSGKGAF